MIQIKTPEGRVYKLPKLSTKRLDPKLKAQGQTRSAELKRGFNAALKKAKELGVPLHKIIPVS